MPSVWGRLANSRHPSARSNAEAEKWFAAKLKEVNAIMDEQFKTYRISEALMTIYRLYGTSFSWYWRC
jgi:valyl-tRNA synthetase